MVMAADQALASIIICSNNRGSGAGVNNNMSNNRGISVKLESNNNASN